MLTDHHLGDGLFDPGQDGPKLGDRHLRREFSGPLGYHLLTPVSWNMLPPPASLEDNDENGGDHTDDTTERHCRDSQNRHAISMCAPPCGELARV